MFKPKVVEVNGYNIARGEITDSAYLDRFNVVVWKGMNRIESHTYPNAMDALLMFEQTKNKYAQYSFWLEHNHPELYQLAVRSGIFDAS